MTFQNLRQFIDKLQDNNDLVIVDHPVSAHLEIAEIHRRVIAAGGPALLFTNVNGKKFPVATNLFGTKERVDLAFGNDAANFIQQAAKLPEELLPPSLSKLWGLRGMAKNALSIGFRKDHSAPVLEEKMTETDVTALPALTSWEKDGGPFLTLPLIHTQSPTGHGADNLGMYRIQLFEKTETGMHFQIGKGGGFHLYEAEKAGHDLPLNLYLGGPPALILSAIAPLPENVPELMLASLVQGKKLKRGKIHDHPIDPIAEAEFCLVGHVPANIRRPEGPFGDHYGYYSLIHDFPVFRVKNIYHRKNAIFPATVVGKPKQEDFFLGDYLQELLSPLFPVVMPGVTDLWSYGETGYHSLSAAVLKERYGREAMASVFRILGEGQLSLTKFLFAIDKPIDLKDFKSVLTHLLERVDWRKDLYIFPSLSMDTLDYASNQLNKGSKGVILGMGDPIRKLPFEAPVIQDQNLVKKCNVFSPGCLVVEVPNYEDDRSCVEKIASINKLKDWPLIVAVDDADKAASTVNSFLWTTFTRFEPASDIYASQTSTVQNHLMFDGPIVIDARMKPWYPDELFCDHDTREKVDLNWKKYFPSGGIKMGSSDNAHLFHQ